MPDDPVAHRVLTQDVTPEKLADLMAQNDERMANFSDEGGLFDIMAGRYSAEYRSKCTCRQKNLGMEQQQESRAIYRTRLLSGFEKVIFNRMANLGPGFAVLEERHYIFSLQQTKRDLDDRVHDFGVNPTLMEGWS